MAKSNNVPVKSSHLLVAAFDFGTTYSGYAFSFRNKPLQIRINNNWIAGSEKLVSLKTPTCILLDPDEKFHSFGFEAENKYYSLIEDDEHHKWMFFRHFKMILYKNEKLSRRTTVEDISGKRMFAIDIFSMAIRYLRSHLLQALDTQVYKIEETDIKYVITVPAIWDDNGKQFMRMAAEQADIDTKRLKLILEPEAASVWCQTVTQEAEEALSKPGSRYMVVDLGGGTADISVHKRGKNGSLKELYKSTGGPWGGIYVDNNFCSWLGMLFGHKVIKRFKKEHMDDYFEIMREFETSKRSVTLNTMEHLSTRVSTSLRELLQKEYCKTLEEFINSPSTKPNVVIKKDKMRIAMTIVKSWFDGPVDNVLSHIQTILCKPKVRGVTSILLVGGFGESPYVQGKFKTELQNRQIIVPDQAGLAVLKGAVRFGHQPSLISERVMKQTYGISEFRPFDETTDDVSLITVINGQKKVEDCFCTFVRCNDTVPLGYEITHTFKPTCMEHTCLSVYCTKARYPAFTSEPGCILKGRLHVKHPEGDSLEEKKIAATLVFGDTEITVKANVVKTGKECSTTIDYLSGISPEKPPSLPPKDRTENGLCARALYAYQAGGVGQVTFKADDVITHIDRNDTGWWFGNGPDGSRGLIPANYVKLLDT